MESLSDFSTPSPAAENQERVHWIYDAEKYAEQRFVHYPKGFIRMRNPLKRVQTALVHLGQQPGSAPPRYAPDLSWDPDHEPSPKQLRHAQAAAERAKMECCKITFAPGEEKWIPREIVGALVTVRDGVVCGGYLPYLQIPGDPNPPELGPSFLATDPFEAE